MSKTIDILGIGKKPPCQYEFKSQEKSYHELAMRAFDQSEKKPKKMAVDCSEMGVAPLGDRGFLSAVVFSYNNHYILQTTPEDWWYTIIHKIGTTVKLLTDAACKPESEDKRDLREFYKIAGRSPDPEDGRKLREFFVSHEGKKTLRVYVPPIPLEEKDFTEVFHQFSEQIRDNIKVPEYVETVRADFSTSTPTHVIESEITLMSSLQNFFDYRMRFLCGIPQIEMMGSEADWRKLKDKFVNLRNVLAPVEACFGKFQDWCMKVEVIFQKLIDTYQGNPDIEWWSHIFNKREAWGSGEPPRYLMGWFINDFLNCTSVEGFEDLPSGLNTVPLILEGEGYPVPVNTTLVAGIAGILVEDSLEVPKVRALHGWALFYDETDSPVKEKGGTRDERWMNQMATTYREERSLELQYTKKWKENGSDRPEN